MPQPIVVRSGYAVNVKFTLTTGKKREFYLKAFVQKFVLPLTLLVMVVPLYSHANPPANLLSVEHEPQPRVVEMPDGRKVTLTTKVNFAVVPAPQKGLKTLDRVRAFTQYMAAKGLDNAWRENHKANVEMLIVPEGTADEVFRNINDVITSEYWLKRKLNKLLRKAKGLDHENSYVIKDALAWKNIIKYEPNISEEKFEGLPEDIKESYRLADTLYSGKESILLGNFENRPINKTINTMAVIRFFVNGVLVHTSTFLSNILAPNVTHLQLIGMDVAAGLFGATMQKEYQRVSKFFQTNRDFKFVERMGVSHNVSHEVQYFLKQSLISMSFLAVVGSYVVATNNIFGLEATINVRDYVANGVSSAFLSTYAGYGLNKFMYDRHVHRNPSPREYRTNARNQIGAFMLNMFVTFGQVLIISEQGNPELGNLARMSLGALGTSGLMVYLHFGQRGLAKTYQSFLAEVKSGAIKTYGQATEWVSQRMARPTEISGAVCTSVFAM